MSTYNRIIRKLTLAFGDLFSNITCVRYNPDGSEEERFLVPLEYSAKELYVRRLSDPNLTKKVQITLPRMSYELTGLSYDSSRKQITNTKQFLQSNSGITQQYVPVPYDFDFSLYLYVRNIEDANQIIEHILPFFAPDYTIKVNLIPELGIIKEVPVLLKNTDFNIDYEGGFEDNETRTIIWTLTFTVKGFVYSGSLSPVGLIKTSITNIYNNIYSGTNIFFNMTPGGTGNYTLGELVYQGASPALSVASGKVIDWSNTNNQLVLQNLSGNFVSNEPLIGMNSKASHLFNSYSVNPPKESVITITPNPITANANSNYTYSISINESP
jgi:T4-like virus Myoviridae tail sheath stabiliser